MALYLKILSDGVDEKDTNDFETDKGKDIMYWRFKKAKNASIPHRIFSCDIVLFQFLYDRETF